MDKEFQQAIEEGNLDPFLIKYGVSLTRNDVTSLINRRTKILVVGDLSGRIPDYVATAKKLGIPESNLEFVSFEEFKNFSLAKLRYSIEYSDIIVGPVPHKVVGLGDNTSTIAMIENANDPNEYPHLIRAVTNMNGNILKFSISEFKEDLKQTRFYQEYVLLTAKDEVES